MASMFRRVVTAALAAGLFVAVTACSESESSSAGSSEASDVRVDEVAAALEKAGVKMTEVATKDGTTQKIPVDVVELAAKRTDLRSQEPQTMYVEEGKYLVNYGTIAGGDQWNVVYTKETGAVPISGQIFRAWRDDGLFDSKVGVPSSPVIETADGFSQKFTNGEITLESTNGRDYLATVTPN